jgi:flagellar basal-body rod protein FlgC
LGRFCHPYADSHGYVRYAGVDTAAEMVTMMSAIRAYEANVAAMNTTRQMVLKALEIGG